MLQIKKKKILKSEVWAHFKNQVWNIDLFYFCKQVTKTYSNMLKADYIMHRRHAELYTVGSLHRCEHLI